MLPSINEYKQLKAAIVRMYKKYVAAKDANVTALPNDSDLHKEST